MQLDGMPVKVVRLAIHVHPRRLARVTWRWSQQIETDFDLFDEVLGGGRWDIGVCVSDCSNDDIHAGADASLDLVAAM